jgi:hypothetical protein
MYVEPLMLATKYDCSIATISRCIREMEDSGRYPTAVQRIGRIKVDDEAFDHFTKTRKRKRREEKN